MGPNQEHVIRSRTVRSPGKALVIFLASGAYLGHVPFAPGTFGTLAGVLIYFGFIRLPLWGYVCATAGVIAAAMWLAGRAQGIYGRKDDGRIVIDEVAGYLVTMIGVGPSLPSVVLGFILFRVFDILKPWPCRYFDRRWTGGAGVVMDDVAAGAYGAAVLHVLIGLWPALGRGIG